ncbi:MAG TPA: HIT domain-containing protein [Planctomycetota bacterium]|nr:HIT domain-containing protein [Planctomycetota bacterium]
MKNLWAPWRMSYIQDSVDQDERCFLCRALEEQGNEGCLILWRSELTFCILNRFPYNNGHLLIATHRHVGEVEKLTPEEMTSLMTDTVRAQGILTRVMHPHGFNWGLNVGRAAGAGLVDHLHMHIVPRWSGDTNFMPVFSDVKVIPQSLEELCALLRAEAGKEP